MEIEQTISTLYTIGLLAIIPAVLTLAGTVVVCIKSPPWQMHRALQQKTKAPEKDDTENTTQLQQQQPQVVKQAPEGAIGWITHQWSRTPTHPINWVSSMKGGKQDEKNRGYDVDDATGFVDTCRLQNGEACSDESISSNLGGA